MPAMAAKVEIGIAPAMQIGRTPERLSRLIGGGTFTEETVGTYLHITLASHRQKRKVLEGVSEPATQQG